MRRISSNFIFVVTILLQTVGLSACNQNQAVNTATPDKIKVYEGYYYYTSSKQEPVSSFVPCGANEKPGPGKGYWLVTHDQFNEMYQPEADKLMDAIIGTLPPDGEFGMYIKFKGTVSPPVDPASSQGYGYQNQYQQQITVTEAIQMKYFIVPWDVDLCKSK